MPDYKEKLRPASFRGVAFGVLESETEGGRRTQVYEFPEKDVPYVEDLGKKARVYNITAFVCGTIISDYMDQRDNLTDALEQEGPGTLVHPYLGELSLQVMTFRVRETKDDGGMASFSITFSETGDILYPVTANNASADVLNNSENLLDLLADSMTEISTEIGNLAQEMLADINSLVNTILSVIIPFLQAVLFTDQLNRALSNILNNAPALAGNPSGLAESLMNVITFFGNSNNTNNPATAFSAVQAIVNGVQSVYSGRTYDSTPAGIQQEINDNLMIQMLVLTGTATAARIAVQIPFTTVEQADAAAYVVDSLIESVIYSITDDNIYQAVIDLKVAVHQAVPSNSDTLKTIESFSVKNSIPALALCYRIYGSLDNYDDLVSRNDIPNPCCIAGGSVLEVLSQ
jgi:prophage DNA circulation protein